MVGCFNSMDHGSNGEMSGGLEALAGQALCMEGQTHLCSPTSLLLSPQLLCIPCTWQVEGQGGIPLDGWGGRSGLDTGHTSLGTTSTQRQAHFHLNNPRTGVLQGVNISEALRPHMWKAIPTGQRLLFASPVRPRQLTLSQEDLPLGPFFLFVVVHSL